ncbi:hypothetical protein [Advenella sp. EE-W14]|uniref:hypothetical protein n=1 Tax=Advenella sp. EE-W14 TaxID=2722705 RepID=UPI00145E9494|nr:hypothetical protein [Advenella sp. EE-W14]
MFRVIFFIVSMFFSSVAITQPNDYPFGLTEGMSKDELKKALIGYEELNEFVTTATSVPKPVSLFDSYVFQSTKETGLCRAFGMTKFTSSNRDLEEDYKVLKESLTKKYGKSKTLDKSEPYTDDIPLIMAVSSEIRRKAQHWSLRDVPGIQEIILEVFAENIVEGYVSVEYVFSNAESCLEIINAEATKGL